jgi:ubiquinone/menaquinone biosynthesis C-methylase UbiE
MAQVGEAWRCSSCAREYPYRNGILSFLEPEQSFNPTSFQDTQEHDWSNSAQLRDRIRNSKLLSLLNWIRIKFSISGRRDRIFYNEMHGGDPNRLILDIGCGGGRHYFTHYGKVVGIDPVLGLLQIAKGMYAAVYHASAFQLPFPNDTFDYVVSSDVIGHIPTELKDTLFAEMYRVLKPGGRTVHVIETDGKNCWFRFAHRYPDLFQRYFVERPGHISLEMPSQLQERFVRHGFQQVRFNKYATNVQECGWLSGSFNNEFRRKSAAVSFLVKLDGLLAGNLATKEITNLLLEPVAQVVDRVTPFDYAGGALVIFEKPAGSEHR